MEETSMIQIIEIVESLRVLQSHLKDAQKYMEECKERYKEAREKEQQIANDLSLKYKEFEDLALPGYRTF